MDMLITFGPLLVDGLIIFVILFVIWRIFKRRSNYKDEMLQQLMAKNKELEEKLNQLLERSKVDES
jgi:flagellar biosynthesis/type III secretory pathway M-ring protein FliF/YscJ